MQFDIEHFKNLVKQEVEAKKEELKVEAQIKETEELLDQLNVRLQEVRKPNCAYLGRKYFTPSGAYINEYYNYLKNEVENVQP